MAIKMIMSHKIIKNLQRKPTPVVLPKKNYLEFCMKISDKVNPVFFEDDTLVHQTHRESYFEKNVLSRNYTGFLMQRFLFSGDEYEWEDFKSFDCNPILATLRLAIRQYFNLPYVCIDTIINEMKQECFIEYNNYKTLIPINLLWPMLKCKINNACMKLRAFKDIAPTDKDFRSAMRRSFHYFEEEYSLANNSIITYIAFVDHYKIPLRSHIYSSNINASILLSQLPQFIGFIYKYVNVKKLDYTFRFIGEIYSSLLYCNLQYTNPVEITESDFVGDFVNHMVDLSMYRPDHIIVKSLKEKHVLFDRLSSSIAQFNLDHKVSIDTNFTNVLEKLVKVFDLAISKVDDTMKTTMSDLRRKLSAFITICYNIYRCTLGELKLQDCIINIIGFLMSTSLSDAIIAGVRSIINEKIAQNSDTFDFIAIYKLIGLAAFVLFAGALPDTKSFTNLTLKLDRIPKSLDGLAKIWNYFDGIMDTIWPWIQVNLLRQEGKYIPRVVSNEVLKWTEDVTELLEYSKRQEIRTDPEKMRLASKLYPQGLRLVRQCASQKLHKRNADMLSKLLPAAKILMDDATKSGADKMRLRQEPLMVWFTGGSGVGKTGLTYPFIIDMMRIHGPVPSNYTQNIYARMAETEYWDAYTDQEYIVIDDAFQAKDSQVNPNPELFEIIRMGNMFAYHQHMAALEEKNNTYFNGKLVVLSSNLERIQVESLNCPEAVARRINLAFRVGIVERYRKYYTDGSGRQQYKLDYAKARIESNKSVNFDVYEFEQFNPMSNEVIRSGLSYGEIVLLGQQYYHNNTLKHDSLSEFLDDYRQREDVAIFKENANAFELLEFSSEGQVYLEMVGDGLKRNMAGNAIKWGLNHSWQLIKNTKNKIYNYIYPPTIYDVRTVSRCVETQRDFVVSELIRNANQVKYFFKSEEQKREAYLRSKFTPIWDVFVAAAALAISGFTLYAVCRIGKGVCEELFIPKYVRDEKKMIEAVEQGNKCITNGCADCRKCKYTFETDNQLKWYTSCSCYADSMEEVKDYFNLYATAAFNHKSRKLEKITKINPETLMIILEQMLNCDCSKCETCKDDKLIDKFSDVCAVYKCSCVCVVARLSQGFALVELLSLIKYIGNLDRGIIKNKFLCKMYQTMKSDIEMFEKSEDYSILSEQIASCEGIKVHQDQIKYNADVVKPTKIIQYQDNVVKKQIKYNPEPTKKLNIVRYQQKDIIEEQRRAPAEDLNADTIVNYVVYPNLVLMRGRKEKDKESDTWHTLGCILFIKGRVALMPYHYIVAIKEQKYFDIQLYTYSKVLRATPVTSMKVHRFEGMEKDAVLVEFPVTMNDFKDITNHFVSIGDYDKVKGCPAVLARLTYEDEKTIKNPIYLESISVSEKEMLDSVIVKGCETVVKTREFYSYNACTRGGDCGSTLVVMNSVVQGKILGIHNSGTPSLNHGNSVAINRDMLKKCLSKFGSIGQYAYESTLLTAPLDSLADSGNFGLHRLVDERLPASSNTALAHSSLYGALIESPNMPAKLRPFKNDKGELIDPIVLQRKKYGIPRPYLEQDLVDSIKEGMKGQYYISNRHTPDYYRMPLTLEQSVKGIEGDQYINAINRSTSPGYPFSQERKGKPGKTLWFGNEMEYCLNNTAFEQLVERINNNKMKILNNIRPEIVWTDTLKDARLPIEKAKLGKTRLFSAAPLDYVIMLREIATPFIAHCSSNRIFNSIAVGINPSSPEWSVLAQRLQSKGKAVIAGDYSNFDGTLPAQLVFAAIEIMVDWYKLHWSLIVEQRRNVICGRQLDWSEFREYCIKLYYECVHHLHITNFGKCAMMYYVRNGIPSGCPVTAILNSIVNRLGLCYIWHKIFERKEIANVTSFIENTSDIYYGDDFIMNISHRVLDQYNQITISEALKKYLDMDMTDELKSSRGVQSHRRLHEVSFLKRKFRFEEIIMEFVAPLDINVILDSINWVRRGNEAPDIITLSVLEASLRELALHSSEVDDDYRERIEELGYYLASRVRGASFVSESRLNVLYNVKNSLWANELSKD
ncbi:hypothetical protein 1 [Hubei picorna-like virus 14]|uniref:hypothetical protein 1 n=1 Tax=Hubei picorna-like virus 14 TaxID=1923093 RepID=UPI00090AA59A|nr:hypothetical protein 1 [Hubei picorna-like virus 14]APG77974.1 hypothetical protein 1 [Hubei picorna-like virus 14]